MRAFAPALAPAPRVVDRTPRAPSPAMRASSSSSSSSAAAATHVYAVSDVHVEYAANMAWVRGLREPASSSSSRVPSTTRVLCVAGDVSDDIDAVRACLREFQRRYDVVAYTFVNHELWLNAGDAARGIDDSLAKIYAILRACASIGVVTTPVLVNDDVWVAPIHS